MVLPMPMGFGNLTIPASDYKWNQVVELQFPDGKKVFYFFFKSRILNIYVSRWLLIEQRGLRMLLTKHLLSID
jgi:hypothetical protein